MKKILAFLVLVLFVSTMVFAGGITEVPSSQQSGQVVKESTLQRAIAAVPVPQVNNFLERKMVAERAVRFDVPNKLGYVYLIDAGIIIGYYTIYGKIASLGSFLVPQDRVIEGGNDSGGYWSVVVQDADIDGTYGSNVDGIFFFTTEKTYVEWTGRHLYSDTPLPVRAPKLNVEVTQK